MTATVIIPHEYVIGGTRDIGIDARSIEDIRLDFDRAATIVNYAFEGTLKTVKIDLSLPEVCLLIADAFAYAPRDYEETEAADADL